MSDFIESTCKAATTKQRRWSFHLFSQLWNVLPLLRWTMSFIPVVTSWNISYFVYCWFEPMLGVVYRHVPGINTRELGPYQSLRSWGNISLIGYTSLLGTWGNTSLVPVLLPISMNTATNPLQGGGSCLSIGFGLCHIGA